MDFIVGKILDEDDIGGGRPRLGRRILLGHATAPNRNPKLQAIIHQSHYEQLSNSVNHNILRLPMIHPSIFIPEAPAHATAKTQHNASSFLIQHPPQPSHQHLLLSLPFPLHFLLPLQPPFKASPTTTNTPSTSLATTKQLPHPRPRLLLHHNPKTNHHKPPHNHHKPHANHAHPAPNLLLPTLAATAVNKIVKLERSREARNITGREGTQRASGSSEVDGTDYVAGMRAAGKAGALLGADS